MCLLGHAVHSKVGFLRKVRYSSCCAPVPPVSEAVKIKGNALSSFCKGEVASAPSSVAKGHPPSIQDQINHKWYPPPPELHQNEFLSRLGKSSRVKQLQL